MNAYIYIYIYIWDNDHWPEDDWPYDDWPEKTGLIPIGRKMVNWKSGELEQG